MSDTIEIVSAQPELPETPAQTPAEQPPVDKQESEKSGDQPGQETPETPESEGDKPEGEQPKDKKPRGWVSERFREMTEVRRGLESQLAAERAERQRFADELAQLRAAPKADPAPNNAKVDMLDEQSAAAFIQEQIRQGISQAMQQREAHTAQQAQVLRLNEFVGKLGDQNEGAHRFLYDTSVRATNEMADFVFGSEHGVQVADHLGNNPADTARIASLDPLRQGIELARLEMRFAAPAAPPPPPPKTTKAPSPTPTVGARGTPGPKPIEEMTQAEYNAARDKGLI